jgi:hypothetical protein
MNEKSKNEGVRTIADFRDRAIPMSEAGPDYRVMRGGRLLGTLTSTGCDMPWFEGVFEPTAAFAEVQRLFDHERQLLEEDRIDEWSAVWDEIAKPGMRLEPLDGREPIADFMLHIDGQKARWRY